MAATGGVMKSSNIRGEGRSAPESASQLSVDHGCVGLWALPAGCVGDRVVP